MKANKNVVAAVFKATLLLLLIGFQSCGTYNSKTSIESDLFNGDFNAAITNIDQNKFLQKDRNKLLYLMEKGKIEHLRGNYESSNALFEQAYIMIDDRIKTNAGQAIAAKFTNPMAEPYKGEDFEKVTIHYYMALNYFHLGMPDEALVEAKRINIKLYELNEKYSENKNKYSEDAFSQILQGLLYEGTGDVNNAFIAYRNAEEIFNRGEGSFFGTPMPEQLKKDLIRTAYQMGFKEEYEAYMQKYMPQPEANTTKKKAATPPPAPQPEGEAVVFWENGLGPAKDQIVITASTAGPFFYGSYMDGDVLEEIIIPIPTGTDLGSINAIAIPKYRERESYYGKATVVADGKEYGFELAQDFYPIAKQCLKDRMLRETIDLVLRFAAKKAASAGLGALGKELLGDAGGELVKLGGDIAGAATEKADTRNWQSLPATISYTRVPLKEGDNKLLIKKYGPNGIVDTDTITIPYKKGLQIVNYFDLGRTQIVPSAQETLSVMASSLSGAGKSGGPLKQTATRASLSQFASIPASSNFKPAPDGVTVQSVIDNYLEATGGAEKLQSLQSQYMHATTTAKVNGTTVTSSILIKTSGTNYYNLYTSDTFTMSSLINQEGAFTIDDKGKRKKMDKAMAEMLMNSTKMYENLIKPLEYGARLDGVATINNEDAYVVSYTEPVSNSTITSYYSTKSGLIIASSSVVNAGGMTVNSTNLFSDFRDVNGIFFPFKMTSVSNVGESEMVYNEVKFNEGVYDSDFQ